MKGWGRKGARSGRGTPDDSPVGDAAAIRPRRRALRALLLGGALLSSALLLFSCSGCSPVYVARAGWAQWQILSARRPLGEVIADPGTDEETRRKLLLARQARAFARHILGLEVGDQYTSYSRLKSDTLAWILSAAPEDRLESKTWWFPIVGSVPYRGYASKSTAEKAQRELEEDGFDTYLRPTSAFSTLGWFSDPILSTFLRYDDVDLVATIIHELAHVHLWVPGRVTFNESYATFVGQTGAIRFFCGPPGTPRTAECDSAIRGWEDHVEFSAYLDTFLTRLQAIYDSTSLTPEEKLEAREEIQTSDLERFRESLEAGGNRRLAAFLTHPVNNAVILSRMRYAHRLPDFQLLLEHHGGDLAAALAFLKSEAERQEDPFRILPLGSR